MRLVIYKLFSCSPNILSLLYWWGIWAGTMFANCWKYLQCLVKIRRTRITNLSFIGHVHLVMVWMWSSPNPWCLLWGLCHLSSSQEHDCHRPRGWTSELILCLCHASKWMASGSNLNCHHLDQNHKGMICHAGCMRIPLFLPLILRPLMNLTNLTQDCWYLKTKYMK